MTTTGGTGRHDWSTMSSSEPCDGGESDLILHRWPSAWGLPSLSPECVAVETYMRLAGLKFTSEDCKTPYASPSGQLPALDQCDDVVGLSEGVAGGAGSSSSSRDHTGSLAAKRIADHLSKKVVNLDAHLVSHTDKALLIAFTALVDAKLATATAYYTWIDKPRFTAHTRKAYGQAFPAPLSYIIPWLWRSRALKRFAGESSDQSQSESRIRAGARDAYAALSSLLSDNGGTYFFGVKPTSLDAAAFAHLSYHALSPVGDALRLELKSFPNLVKYVEAMRTVTFPNEHGHGGTGGSAMHAIDSGSWLEQPSRKGRTGWWGRGRGDENDGEKKKPRETAKDARFRRRSTWSLGIAGAAVLGYLFVGELLTFVFSEDEAAGGDDSNAQQGEGGGPDSNQEHEDEPLDDDDTEEPPPEE